MFTKFNYSPYDSSFFKNNYIYGYYGDSLYKKSKSEVQKCLEEFIRNDGCIDGSQIKEHWFNVQRTDVFLSHSHKDLEEVKCFAGWLKHVFGLTSFIDSCTWGYCDDLLKQIDDKYCKFENSNSYDYTLRNYSTSHVHMMLSTALTEMMDRCECVIFFNTPNSISISSEISKRKNEESATLSPWIYHELSMTSMLRVTPPEREGAILEHTYMEFAKSELNVKYDVNKLLKGMITLTDSDLLDWKNSYNGKNYQYSNAFDCLYNIMGINRH